MCHLLFNEIPGSLHSRTVSSHYRRNFTLSNLRLLDSVYISIVLWIYFTIKAGSTPILSKSQIKVYLTVTLSLIGNRYITSSRQCCYVL
jgi:hypothetical protein